MKNERKRYSHDTLPLLLEVLKGWHCNGKFEWGGNSYIKGVNDNAADALLGKIMGKVRINDIPLMIDASNNADTHFEVPHDQLDGEYNAEWDGISWGWQDCIKKLAEALPPIPDNTYKSTRL